MNNLMRIHLRNYKYYSKNKTYTTLTKLQFSKPETVILLNRYFKEGVPASIESIVRF